MIEKLLNTNGATLHSYKDQVVFEKEEVIKDDGTPYTVFTPYSKKWKTKLTAFYLKTFPTEENFSNFYKQAVTNIPSLESMGFRKVDQPFPSGQSEDSIISE